jgi:hypothetical protein
MYNIFPVFWVFYVNKIEALNDAFIKTLLQILRNAINILSSHIDKKKWFSTALEWSSFI